MQNIPIKSLRNSPNNPRKIEADKLERLKKSLTDFPEMLSLRPLVVKAIDGGKYEVLGGNMRLKALKDLGYKEVPCTVADGLTAEQEREFMIKDNLGFGDWDFDALRTDWDAEELADWGLDLPEWGEELDSEEFGEDFNLPEGDKAPFQQMTLTFADEQAEFIKNQISQIKQSEEYKYAENYGNENSNGNALFLIVKQWAEQKR